MKKYIVLIPILMLLSATNLWATTYTGTLTVGGGLFATQTWATPGATLDWSVTDPAQSGVGHWVYTYTFNSNDHDISHIIIKVSNDFTSADMLTGTTSDGTLDTYSSTSQGNSNPGMPNQETGIKWNAPTGPDATSTMTITIVTDRAPDTSLTIGNFYAVNGKGTNPTYAYSDGSGGVGLPMTPDTATQAKVPEPLTLILYGFGFAGAGIYRRLRRPRKSP